MTDQKPEKKTWYEHPLASVPVGILLTGVLGTALPRHFMDRREKEKLRAQAALDRKEVVMTLSELLAAAQYSGELLAEAVESDKSGDVITERMREYESSYEAGRIQRGSALLLARDLVADDDYQRFDDFVHQRLQERTLAPLRRCLLTGYSQSTGETPGTQNAPCDLDALMRSSSRCSAALVEGLYVFAETSVTRSRGADLKQPAGTRRRIDQARP